MNSSIQPRLGVHSLDHFSVQVPDLSVATDFFRAFGLNVRGSDRQLELLTFGSDHPWAMFTRGPGKALGYLSFGIYSKDLEGFRQRMAGLGIEPVSAPASAEADQAAGFWIRDPHGVLIQLRVCEKSSLFQKPIAPPEPKRPRGAPMREEAGAVRPRRMCHALFFTPDINRSIQFYADALGLKLSDHPGPVCFMHGIHGSDHHMIAFAESSKGVGYHHSAWDVATIDEVGLGSMQMAEAGYARGWGVGRHVLGSNYFYYVRDPWGSYAEYSFDIDFIPETMDWEASYPSPENSIYLWGPNLPEDFVTNYETQQSQD